MSVRTSRARWILALAAGMLLLSQGGASELAAQTAPAFEDPGFNIWPRSPWTFTGDAHSSSSNPFEGARHVRIQAFVQDPGNNYVEAAVGQTVTGFVPLQQYKMTLQVNYLGGINDPDIRMTAEIFDGVDWRRIGSEISLRDSAGEGYLLREFRPMHTGSDTAELRFRVRIANRTSPLEWGTVDVDLASIVTGP